MDNFNLQGYMASGKLYSNSETLTEAKKQGDNDELDDSLGAKNGKKKQDMKQRRADSENMEKAKGKRKYSGDKSKDKVNEKQDSKKGNESEQKRMEGAIKDDRDHIKGLKKDIEDNERKLARLKKDYKKDVIKEEEEDTQESYKMKVSELKAKIKENILAELSLSEADEDIDVDIDVEDEVEVEAGADDIEIERPGVTTTVDVGLSPEEEVVQDSLTAAMKAAQELGNTKLADQIGNTITFFTREFVVGQNTD